MAKKLTLGNVFSDVLTLAKHTNKSIANKQSKKRMDTPITQIQPFNTTQINVSTYLRNKTLSSCLPLDIFFKMTNAQLKGEKHIFIDNDTLRNCEAEYEKRKAYDRYLKNVSDLNNKGVEYEKAGEIKKAIAKYEKCIEVIYEHNDSKIAWHSPERLRILYKKTNNPKELEFLERFAEFCDIKSITIPDAYHKRINQLKNNVF